MATTRQLEIAGMAGTFKLRLRDVANQSIHFRSICGGKISVDRSPNGTTYIVESDTDHFRVYVDIVTPDDLPTLFTWDDCTASGWWQLSGFPQVDFRAGNWPGGLTAKQISASKDLGEPTPHVLW